MLTTNWKRRAILASAALTVCGMHHLQPAARGAAVVATGTWTGAVNSAWNEGGNWTTSPDYPSGTGAIAVFEGPTASRTVNPAEAITLGGIQQNNTANFASTIGPSTSGSITFDNLNLDPVTINVVGTGTGNLTISAPSSFTDSVIANVAQTSATSAAGSLNWTGSVSGGDGGFTKTGGGMLTFGTFQKQYTGATLFDTDSGRTRISVSGRPSATSGITVRSGAQLEFITAGTYAMGPGSLTLNGSGLGPGSTPGNFPGVIRPTTGIAVNITNPIVLESDSLIHVQADGGGAGATTFNGAVSGPGVLTFIAVNSNQNLGKLVLGSASNTYTGGTVLNGGTVDVISGTGLGTGPLSVNANVAPGFVIHTRVNLSTTEPTTTGSLSGVINNAPGSALTIDNGGHNYTVNQTNDGTYVGNIAGAGGFGLGNAGTATLTLTAPLSYIGPTSADSGKLVFAQPLTNSSAVSAGGAGTVQMAANGTNNNLIRTPSVSTSGGGRIDLVDNKLITSSPAGTFVGAAYTGVAGLVDSGRGPAGNALWNGSGIVTSDSRAIDNGDLISIGVVDASDKFRDGLGAPIAETDTAVFAGQTVTGADTLVMATWGGDANLDGKINIDDYGQIDSNVSKSGTVFGWNAGDFNYDGKINIDDYGIIDGNIGRQTGTIPTAGGIGGGSALDGVAAVPEPASLGLIAAVALGRMARRRRAR